MYEETRGTRYVLRKKDGPTQNNNINNFSALNIVSYPKNNSHTK